MEKNMRAKLMAGAAALALSTCTILASVAPASAQRWGGHGGWHGGWGWGGSALAAGIIGGAVAAATSPYWAPGYYDYYAAGYPYGPYGYDSYYAPPPAVAVAPGPVVAQGGDAAWCEAHYRSYNPSTGTFTGYDGQQHPCP
jgi:BA14K-like protein